MEERWREPAALAEQYAGMLYRLAYARTGSRADAEDVTEEVFFAVKRKAYLYRPGTDARAWIFQIAKNLSLDELRRRKRRAEPLEEAGEPAVPPRLPALDLLTKCLDETEREIVLLHAVWGYKHREIAQMKGMPLGTVTWKYNAALEKLRKEWEES
ncbi:MAG: RNA polymerase sigma factor [Firmicutes bacterium]|nr:RNA polymerase sigma factor [Bacillota bacterium]